MQAAVRAREQAGVLEALDETVEPGSRVLEVGAGTGHYTVWLAGRAASVVATDASQAMLAYLRARLDREGLDNVETRLASLPEPLADGGPFDAAVAVGVLNYMPDLGQALDALAASLQPGGRAVFTVPLRTVGGRAYALGEALSRRRVWTYAPEEVRARAAEAGLAVRSLTRLGLTRRGFNLLAVADRGPPGPSG
jgi:cyclopropane fatty-acyl-phospholipid synthase-like methyltransferase